MFEKIQKWRRTVLWMDQVFLWRFFSENAFRFSIEKTPIQLSQTKSANKVNWMCKRRANFCSDGTQIPSNTFCGVLLCSIDRRMLLFYCKTILSLNNSIWRHSPRVLYWFGLVLFFPVHICNRFLLAIYPPFQVRSINDNSKISWVDQNVVASKGGGWSLVNRRKMRFCAFDGQVFLLRWSQIEVPGDLYLSWEVGKSLELQNVTWKQRFQLLPNERELFSKS